MVKHVDFSSPSFSELWQQFKNKYWYFFCYISHNIFYWKFERLQYNAYIFEQDTNFWYHCTLIFESLPYFPVFHPIVTLNELAELSTTSHSRCINYGKRNFYFGLNGIEWLSKSRGRDRSSGRLGHQRIQGAATIVPLGSASRIKLNFHPPPAGIPRVGPQRGIPRGLIKINDRFGKVGPSKIPLGREPIRLGWYISKEEPRIRLTSVRVRPHWQ